MSEEQGVKSSGRRKRGAEPTARAEALERLKTIRRGDRRSENGGGYDIKVKTPIFETVSVEDYEKIVARRREEDQGFIIDDNGLGYVGLGEEEAGWSRAGLPPSSDESDGDDPNGRSKTTKKVEKETGTKRVNPAAEIMGKQRILSMFSPTVLKSKDSRKVKSLDFGNMVEDVIAEFAADEGDRQKRRRGHVGLKVNAGFVTVCTGDSSLRNSPKKAAAKEENAIDAAFDSASSEVIARQEINNSVEVKPVKVEGGRPSDADMTMEKKGSALSATADWQAFRNCGNGSVEAQLDNVPNCEDLSDFELEADGSLPFYVIDVHEEGFGANMGTLHLFGKVKVRNAYHSCCVAVKNNQRCVYAIPNTSIFPIAEMIRLEEDFENLRISPAVFHENLQNMAYDLKNEIAEKLLALNISRFVMTPVKRKYAFERSDIPAGENYVLKITYPFKEPPLPADLKGETFCALLGTHNSALELFLVKRKIKGPSWLSVSKFSTCPPSQRVSWCKFEIIADSPKDIRASPSITEKEIPPVVVTSISLKTILNEKQNVNEIVSASLVCFHKAKIDTPMMVSELKKPGMLRQLSHFTVIRKLHCSIFPVGFSKGVSQRNSKAGSNVLVHESSERALLNRLMIELNKLDSDVLVGHNISGFDLHVLLHRAQACGVPSSMWSKIGRLKRSMMPKLTKGKAIYGSGASPGIMSCIAGRILCDTYLCSRDLLKEDSYSLTQLARNCLNKQRKEIAPHEISTMFQTSKSLIELIENGETDAWLSMELMFHLNVLPLTRQLTNISGNLWGKTLQGARAQIVEYLLLHEFHAKKYIVPDKNCFQVKEQKTTKRRMNRGAEDKGDERIYNVNIDNDGTENGIGKAKKGPSYAGGLVLEPKKGLYDKYVLLLDFNSLYPSIIQEYNICFTTVEKPADGLASLLPCSTTPGVLPELLRNLMEKRKEAQSRMKNASGSNVQQFDIEQRALKLIANSTYGCLGFSNWRFYAKHLAELITLQGRMILQSTVDLVQKFNLEVIYGDTDSIMIHTGLDDIGEAQDISKRVICEVNNKYRCLKIKQDGLYKRVLLLKKKKYAAVKVQFRDGKPAGEVTEQKGLDVVRHDWSLLSKELGNFCLDQILSGGSCKDVVESIHNSLMKVQEEMRKRQVHLDKYVITKTLTKAPEEYPDAQNQPHVLVALRLKQNGYTSGCSVGDRIPYVICCEQGTTSGSSTGVAQRARHPEELKKDDGKWTIDIDYYLSQQIHPVVSRLCASIQGATPESLADCLGINSSKFRTNSNEAVKSASSSSLFFPDERYQSCEPLKVSCPSCFGSFECPAICDSICFPISDKPRVEQSMSNFWQTWRCPKCPVEGDVRLISPGLLANQVKRQVDGFIALYYKAIMTCDNENCMRATRSLNLRMVGDSERGTVCPNYPHCNGRLVRKFTAADLYKQLSYFCHLLDTERCMEKVEFSYRIQVETEMNRIRPMVQLASETVRKLRDRCPFGWIQLSDLSVSV